MSNTLNDRLVANVTSMTDIIAPILAERPSIEEFHGLRSDVIDELNGLLSRFGSRTFVMLAFTSAYLRVIRDTFVGIDQEGRSQSIQLVKDFLRFAIRLYKEHVVGFEKCRTRDELDLRMMLRQFEDSKEPFGDQCQTTYITAWMLSAQADVMIGNTHLLECAISMQEAIVREMFDVGAQDATSIARHLQGREREAAMYRQWAADMRGRAR